MQNAASVAGLMLTTEALVAEQPKGGKGGTAVATATLESVLLGYDRKPCAGVVGAFVGEPGIA